MKPELLIDVVLVGAGLLAFFTARMMVARADAVCVLAVACYLALARRFPRLLPQPFAATTTGRRFVSVVRALATTAVAGAVLFSVAGTALFLAGLDALD